MSNYFKYSCVVTIRNPGSDDCFEVLRGDHYKKNNLVESVFSMISGTVSSRVRDGTTGVTIDIDMVRDNE